MRGPMLGCMKTTVESDSAYTPRSASSPGRFRWVVACAAIVGIVPYVALKVLWISGSRVGIDDPEFGRGGAMAVLNAGTAVMDVIAVLLALSFVTEWGRKIPAPVLLLPMWVATGLLGQILVILPVQLVVGTESSPEGKGASVLADWVPTVVYSGFAWQGFFLILGFALYAKDRWGTRVIARGPEHSGVGAGLAVIGCCAIAVSTLVSKGPGPLETVNAVASSVIALFTGAAVVVFAWNWGSHRLPLVRLAAAGFGWFGSGAMFAWGTYLTVMAVVPNDLRSSDGIDVASVMLTSLTAAVGAICGIVLLRTIARRPNAANVAN